MDLTGLLDWDMKNDYRNLSTCLGSGREVRIREAKVERSETAWFSIGRREKVKPYSARTLCPLGLG